MLDATWSFKAPSRPSAAGQVAAAINDILAICKQYNVPCGHPHVDSKNVEGLIQQGFRWLMPAPVRSFGALELGRRTAGRG